MRPNMLTCEPCCADVDEAAKKEVKDILLSYDRTLLVADPRRCEPKKCASFQHQLKCMMCCDQVRACPASEGFSSLISLHHGAHVEGGQHGISGCERSCAQPGLLHQVLDCNA